MGDQVKVVIRTSDRATFRTCRQLWDFVSKNRMDYEPITRAKPLEFGTAIHTALEAYYNPVTWETPNEARALVARGAFMSAVQQQRNRMRNLSASGELDPELEQDYEERQELGIRILDNYCTWASTRDTFTPVEVENEFEIPIPTPQGVELPTRIVDIDGYMYLDGVIPFVYQGRLDLLLKDSYGDYWIMDHKTAGQFGETAFMDLDMQASSYAWAVSVTKGIRPKGVIFNQIRKSPPKPPKELLSGQLSKAKNQDTTYDMYVSALKERNLWGAPEYDEILNYLRENEKEYVRRIWVDRSETELRNIVHYIGLEAIEMANDPYIYPNPNMFNCNTCMFRNPCLAKQDGSDYEFLLETNYVQRGRKQHA